NLPPIQSALKNAGALEVLVVVMGPVQKQSRFVAWTFLDKAQSAQR
ncbi:RlmF-related methyltransferase, partial [Pseudomonas syringae group genomosp. 7]